MKKILALLLCLVLCLGLFAGCGETVNADDDDKIKIVTTIFPIYDWTMNMIGDDADKFDVTMLVDNGTDMHSYQATTADMVSIHTCDLLIYVGGDSDAWIEDLLATTTNTEMKVISLVEAMGSDIFFEEIVEGMEHDDDCCEEDHDHADEECTDDCCEEDHDHADEECTEEECEEDHVHTEECEDEEIDEHVWLSLRNAQSLCKVIASTISEIDSENQAAYQTNCESYVAELSALDATYTETLASATLDTLLFADRFPFRYFVEDYNINYYAAFAGCSAETEASFETIVFLAGKTDELELEYIIVVEGVAHEIAETVISSTQNKNQTILSVNSMESITSADAAAGTTYLSIMADNLEIFKTALN